MPSSCPSATGARDGDASSGDGRGKGERIRLLLLTDTSVMSAGGSERFLRNLVSNLPAERYAITMIQLTAGGDSGVHEVVPKESNTNIRVLRMPIGAIYGLRGWRALWFLRKLARRERFDLIQSQHEKSDLINALLPRDIDAIRISNRRDMGFKKSPRLRFAFRLLNDRFDCIVAPSRQILSGLHDGESSDPARMQWIPNGVDVTRFKPPSAPERASRRDEHGIPPTSIVFGCVASFTPVKRHADLLAAFARVHEANPDTRLLLVGDGPLRHDIESRIASLGLDDSVLLPGNHSDVTALLSACDALVLASSTEGMSNAILEGMACGLPVIATSVGGNPHLVEDGVSGLLVPPQDPDALANAMSTLAASPEARQRMGAAARDRSENAFSLQHMVYAFDRMYCRLLQA